MRNLKIGLRLALLVPAFLVPILYLVYLLTKSQAIGIEFAEAEVKGIEYHRPARILFEDLMQYRTYAAGFLAGDASFQAQMQSKATEIDADLAQMAVVDAQLGEMMHTTPLLTALKNDWSTLKAATPGLSPEDSIRRHNQLVYDSLRVIIKMGNHSNLILDPDIDSYYLMDATQFKLAYEADQITQLQAWGLIATIRGAQAQPLSDAARAEIEGTSTRMRQYMREGMDNIQYSLDYNPDLNAALAGMVTVTEASINTALESAEKELLRPATAPTLRPAQWMAVTDAALDGDLKLFDGCLANLDVLLAKRIGGFKSARMFALLSVGVAVMLALAFTILVARSIIGPIGELGRSAEKISMGELELTIDTSGRDEISDLAVKFGRMQQSMKIASQAGDSDL